jgi:transketolase
MSRYSPFASNIRKIALQMVHRAKASHIGGVLSIADILSVLYSDILNVRSSDPQWDLRDRFILSKGHCCAGVYAALSLREFISSDEILTYAQDGSRLMSHISHKVPGVEFSTGSLGHGLPFGVGKALAAKMKSKPWRTFVLMSDGELDEGSNWEAFMFAAHHGLDGLVAIIDYNKLQSLTTVDNTLRLEPLRDKLEAFGWCVREVNGHDHHQIQEHLNAIPWKVGTPSVLIAHTIKGKGVSFMENKVEWHYRSPSDTQLTAALDEIAIEAQKV